MRLTFLGTSAGMPTKSRNVSALAVQPGQKREWLLFDCGEATQHRIMQTALSLFRLEKIFITHLHGDHIYGLFGLIASRGMLQAATPLSIYGPSGLKDMIKSVFALSRLKLPFDLSITEIEGEKTLEFGDYSIRTVPLSHSIYTLGYVMQEAERPGRFDRKKAFELGIPEGPLYGCLQRGESITLDDGRRISSSEVVGPPRPGRRIIIAGDNDRPELFEAFGDVDLMVHEATYTQKDFDSLIKKYQHTTAKKLAIVAEKMKVKKLILTHISTRYDTRDRELDLLEEARAHYSGSLFLAHDLMTLHLK